MRGQRTFFQHHALQAALVVFQQFGRAEVARNQDRILPQALGRRRAQLARDGAQQAVRQILKVVHPVGQQRIVDLPHPHPGALLHALDRCLGGQAAADRVVDPPAPALVISEHLVSREDLLVLAADAELGLTGHPLDLLAHLVEGEVDSRTLGLDILGHGMLDGDARLVEHRHARCQPLDQRLTLYLARPGQCRIEQPLVLVDQVGIGDQFGQHHGHRLQGLDLDLFITARLGMLNAQHAHRPLAAHDRHAGEGMELFLSRFRPIGKVRVRGRLSQVQRIDMRRDGADQPLAHRQAGNVHRLLRQPAGGKQLQRTLAQQVDRADLGMQTLAHHIGHGIELGLRVAARSHHLMQAGEYLARGGNGADHAGSLAHGGRLGKRPGPPRQHHTLSTEKWLSMRHLGCKSHRIWRGPWQMPDKNRACA